MRRGGVDREPPRAMGDAGLMFGQRIVLQSKVILFTAADVDQFLFDRELSPGIRPVGDCQVCDHRHCRLIKRLLSGTGAASLFRRGIGLCGNGAVTFAILTNGKIAQTDNRADTHDQHTDDQSPIRPAS